MFKEREDDTEGEVARIYSDKAAEMCKVACKICNCGECALIIPYTPHSVTGSDPLLCVVDPDCVFINCNPGRLEKTV